MYSTLDAMLGAVPKKSKRSSRGNDKQKWTQTPDWWTMSQLSAPFTFASSEPELVDTAFRWLNDRLESDPKPNWCLDGVIFQALALATNRVGHDLLVAYADRRSSEES